MTSLNWTDCARPNEIIDQLIEVDKYETVEGRAVVNVYFHPPTVSFWMRRGGWSLADRWNFERWLKAVVETKPTDMINKIKAAVVTFLISFSGGGLIYGVATRASWSTAALYILLTILASVLIWCIWRAVYEEFERA